MRATQGEPSVALLQAACVGGGGVINNGICFALPDATLREWRRDGFPVTDESLWRGYAAVADDLDIGDLGARAARLNPTGKRLERVYGPSMAPDITKGPQPGFFRLAVNFERTAGAAGCRSEGLCNHGCGSERKRNSYQVYLKQATQTGHCAIVERATVLNIEVNRRSRDSAAVEAFRVRLANGHVERVRARQFVLSCGAVGSSAVLLRAEDPNLQAIIATSRPPLAVGARFAGNITSPVIGFADEVLHQETSVQMSHVQVPEGTPGYLLETWFAPPGSMALVTPGSFAAHRDRMARYNRMMCLAPLIGTLAAGSITSGFGGIEIRLPIGPSELARLRESTVLGARALLAAGADEVLIRLGNGRVVRNEHDLAVVNDELANLGRNRTHLLSLSCAHPQGGNAMSDDPAVGVVDGAFRFRGIQNLRVCDGSIFPGAAGVNPQWTIMALAHLCAEELLTQ
ncbi:MAG: GMC family oxidoreductase N-terminal domain-containing protein, partial [Gemmatimonadetes bacterium]|nr:GMC family oxidoreductase N-terminal domain-containing protein [Gemmatimonadota bacterium]